MYTPNPDTLDFQTAPVYHVDDGEWKSLTLDNKEPPSLPQDRRWGVDNPYNGQGRSPTNGFPENGRGSSVA